MKRLFCILCCFSFFAAYGSSQADLINDGSGFIYDDVRNITWYNIPNYTTMTYSGYVAWAAALTVNEWSEWRLPSLVELESIPSTPGIGPDDTLFPYMAGSGYAAGYDWDFYSTDVVSPGFPMVRSFQTNSNYAANPEPWYYWIHAIAVHDGRLIDPGPGPGPAPVPEPTTMLLFGTGLAGLAAFGRRRNR